MTPERCLNRDLHMNVARVGKLHPDEPDMLITLKEKGDMNLASAKGQKNRIGLFSRLSVDEKRVYALQQTHSRAVFDSTDVPRNGKEGDGLVAADPSHVLTVTVADCMPVFLFDVRKRVFALVHSGWQGTGIAAEAVGHMRRRYSCRPDSITAVLGPSIRSCCYRVDRERAERFGSIWGEDTVRWVDSGGEEKVPYLDLLTANRRLLAEAGVRAISCTKECTACASDLGSYRREGPSRFTRMLAMIGFFE